MFSAMRYEAGVLSLVDQRLLPAEERWLKLDTAEGVAEAIETMVVRGAPAIGCSAAFGIAIDARRQAAAKVWADYKAGFTAVCDRMARTRPTAVNLFHAITLMKSVAAGFADNTPIATCQNALEDAAKQLCADDLATCQQIGRNGAAIMQRDQKVNVLTHCNTGSLATAGYGTALGVIRSLYQNGQLGKVYVDETRPYMQGTRLTSFELRQDRIPFELIVDSAAAYLMQKGMIDWIVVGADRIAANGDTANKIGTYSLAVNAKFHNVAFYVAAPLTTFDIKIPTGADIPVEMRTPEEITTLFGQRVAPDSIDALNPSFDVTPADLITGIITEHGVLRPPYTDSIANLVMRGPADSLCCP